MTPKEHNRLAGIFLMAHGGMQLVVMVFLGIIYGGIGSVLLAGAKKQDEQFAGAVLILFTIIIFIVASAFAGTQLIAGWKLIKEKPNARTWGIVGSIISTLSFPIGTAAGVFGLVFLFGDKGKLFYLQNDMNRSFLQPPPPPNSWQQ